MKLSPWLKNFLILLLAFALTDAACFINFGGRRTQPKNRQRRQLPSVRSKGFVLLANGTVVRVGPWLSVVI